MAITTLDELIAGFQKPESFLKAGVAMEAAGVYQSFWYTAGRPGAAAANAAGVNGRAVDPSLVAGEIARANPGSGNAYLARLAAQATQPGTLLLIDRLWENSGLSVTSTSAQGITPAALPARDRDGSTEGDDVLAGVEWSSAGGAGVPTVTLTYTDELGNTGATAAYTAVATPVAGTFEMFPLAAGDYGVRAPTSYQLSATRTSGAMHIVLFRIIVTVAVPAANVGAAVDAVTSGLPRIYDDSVLQFIWLPTATTLIQLSGQYIEAHG